MYSKRPAEFGETPTKVVFDGVGPDVDPAALNALYVANLGTISAFQAKARQSRQISDQPASSMNQALPNGQQLRYTYNGGQETIHVTLTPEQIAAALTPIQPEPDQPCDILLAIDVLFDPATFVVGDIYHKVPYVVHDPGGQPMYPNDPQYYVYDDRQLVYGDPSKPFSPSDDEKSYYNGAYFEETGSRTWGGQPVNGGNNTVLDDKSYGTAAHAKQYELDFNANPFHVYPASGADVRYESLTTYYGGYNTSFGITANVVFQIYALYQYFPRYVGPVTPPSDTTHYHVYRERRTYLDILPVVGLRIASKDASKAPDKLALSAGDHAQETDALRAVADGDTTAIQRSIAFADPAGGNHFYGASFTAKVTLLPNQPLSDIEIEVYLGSGNVTRQNNAPGLENSTFAADDSSMRYSATNQLTYRVRVREITDAGVPPMVVRVETKAEGKIEQMGPDDTNTVTSTAMDPEARQLTWRFAAGSAKWQDGGREPADPTAKDADNKPAMGKLLLESDSDQQKTVAMPNVQDRTVPTEPVWKQPVTSLTLVDTIVWSPPTACHIHGSAKFKGSNSGGGGPGGPGQIG